MKKKILVIDDEAILRNLAKRILERAGFEVLCAPNGEKGLALIEDRRPEVVLLDLAMPGIGGLGFLRILKKMELKPKVVIVSGSIDQAAQDEAGRLGAAHYVRKPFELEDLLKAIG